MDLMHLYHGSTSVVETPTLERCKPHNDYGPGFYCTLDLELAKEWACRTSDGFANAYVIDTSNLTLLDLNAEKFSILHWLEILLENRFVNLSTPTMERGKHWLQSNFRIDTSRFDIIKGYRADDSYFGFARAFLRNEITLDQLTRSMRLGELGEQYMLKSPHAFASLRFNGCEPVDFSIYGAKRAAHDERARARFREIVVEEPERVDGKLIYLSTLMDLPKEALDACLR